MENGMTEIPCAPDEVITDCLSMIDQLEPCLKNANFSGDLRKEVWEREIQDIRGQSAPNTLITVCGATGVGKSSLLNAVLDAIIVPTSSMHACTSVVTEISYHDKPTIDADVPFLSEDDWKNELTILLQDLHDEGKNIKRAIESRSHAKAAWQKVNAVYPLLSPSDLGNMKVDDIIAIDPDIAKLLGTTHHIQSEDSMTFGQEIGKYVNATERSQKGGKNDKKEGEKGEAGEAMAEDTNEETLLKPALWPLIRQVTIRCQADALSTGAILVDLPGVADTNAARNQIAKNYLKKSHRIWILAPITRAVDDKVAKDLLGEAFKYQIMNGNYDHNRITFIATKTDDLSCAEVIKGLQLQEHPELQPMEDELVRYRGQLAYWKTEKKRVWGKIKAISKTKDGRSKETKRKRKGCKSSPSKRIHLEEEEVESSLKEVDEDEDSDLSADAMINRLLDDGDDDEDDDEDDEPSPRKRPESPCEMSLSGMKARVKEAADAIAKATKDLAIVQRKKNAFCSLRRSKFTCGVLKEDFRRGLKELDEQVAEEEDPDNFDPDADIRDYESIDLPVFTCSSRDYLRLKGYASGDGDPVCFSDPEDTAIPELQSWCHELTSNSRQRCAMNLLRQLKAISATIKSHVGSRYNISQVERASLRQKWQTPVPQQMTTSQKRFKHSPDSDGDLVNALLHDRGIMPRLKQGLDTTIDESVQRYFKSSFQQGLEDQCKIGAKDASKAAVDTHDEFAASMHWNTYRAVLRRHGKWNRNLNVELTLPFMRAIAKAWVHIFLSDLWQPFVGAANNVIETLLQDMESSAITQNLKDVVKMQADICLKEWTVALKKIVDVAEERLKEKQKEISRFFEDHVSRNLTEGYKTAVEQRGPGSVKRQKETIRKYISDNKHEMFEHGADTIMELLDMAADAVSEMLKTEISDLPKKAEANMSILWEVGDETPEQTLANKRLLETVEIILGRVELTIDAGISEKYAGISSSQSQRVMPDALLEPVS